MHDRSEMKKIIILLPVYNDWESLLKVLDVIKSVINDIQKYNSEIILEKLGLKNVISSQRTNGFSNAVEKIKKLAI